MSVHFLLYFFIFLLSLSLSIFFSLTLSVNLSLSFSQVISYFLCRGISMNLCVVAISLFLTSFHPHFHTHFYFRFYSHSFYLMSFIPISPYLLSSFSLLFSSLSLRFLMASPRSPLQTNLLYPVLEEKKSIMHSVLERTYAKQPYVLFQL